jgi:hypothetical protein
MDEKKDMSYSQHVKFLPMEFVLTCKVSYKIIDDRV